MNRADFCAKLRAGLSGLPPETIDDIVADHEAHFAEGAAAGRSEHEVAAALGDPTRLARELRVEAGLQRWEEKRTPGSALAAVLALIGLGAVDIFLLLPLLIGVIGGLFGFYMASIGVFVGGASVLAFGPFTAPPGGPVAAILLGLGMIAGAIAVAVILTLVTIGVVNAVVWYARLHYRALKLADPS